MLARKDEDSAGNGFQGGVELVLDQTAEFCRGLGEVGNINIVIQEASLCNIQVGHWQDMQSGLGGGTVDKELLDFEAGLEQEAGARFDEAVLLTLFVWYNYTRRLGDLKFMSRMRSAVEWSKQMDLDEEKAGGGGGGGGERQRGTWEEVELF